MIRYGILNVEEAIKDHLGRWFNVRIKKEYICKTCFSEIKKISPYSTDAQAYD